MKSCARWADAIADCALGKAAEPDLAAHLLTCPQCQSRLEEDRSIALRMDQALHRSAAVDPPVYGPDRVMAQITKPTTARAWWKWPALASAALAIWIIVIWAQRPAPHHEVLALSMWRSPTDALLRPPVAAAWTTRPRLGEEFFKTGSSGESSSGEKHAQ